MADTMKALAKTKPAEGLELIDAPIPVAGDEDVLIKVHRTAVCGAAARAQYDSAASGRHDAGNVRHRTSDDGCRAAATTGREA